MLSFKPTFSLSSFTFIKRLFSSSYFRPLRVVPSAYLRLLRFLLAILIQVCASSSPVFLMMYSAYKLNKQGDNIQPWRTPFPIWNLELQTNLALEFRMKQAKANRVLPREHTGHSKHPLSTTQENLYTWTSPDGQHQNQIDYILCSQRWRSSIQSAKTRPGADCGLDHELLIAKFRLKWKKVRKTTRPFRYDLNQIPYDYTVEVRNRFKELDLIDRVPDELWM